ncbi:MAG TPA: hypothetical protein DEP05_04065 [Betaproteobacteria bacterium]|nr:hypothetical protein [Betaproteobacteria bacterium]
MNWLTTNLIAALLLPPLNLILLGGAGLLLLGKRPRLGKSMAWAALLLLYLLSTPWVANHLLMRMETPPVVLQPGVGAIVVLGGGRYLNAPEYGGDTVSQATLVRLRYAARLYRLTHKPILVSGGKPDGGRQSEAALMAETLTQDFHVPVRWIEGDSNNTAENAADSARLLRRAGIDRIYLVTHAWHMPRAKMAFTHAGMRVVPAATGYTGTHPFSPLMLLPDAGALGNSAIAFHEVIGWAWYALKYTLGN